jgi:hypothetical protein
MAMEDMVVPGREARSSEPVRIPESLGSDMAM